MDLGVACAAVYMVVKFCGLAERAARYDKNLIRFRRGDVIVLAHDGLKMKLDWHLRANH